MALQAAKPWSTTSGSERGTAASQAVTAVRQRYRTAATAERPALPGLGEQAQQLCSGVKERSRTKTGRLARHPDAHDAAEGFEFILHIALADATRQVACTRTR